MRRIARTLAVAAILAAFVSGCACVTKENCKNADGTSRLKEHGSILVVGNWNYDRTLDEQGNVIKRDDCNELFPLFKVHVVENEDSVKTDGYALLLFTFNNTEPKAAKTAAPATQTASQ